MDEKISLLRKLSSQQDMRKQLLGGYSEEDVATYVNNITKHYQQVETEYKQELENLQASKKKLRREFDQFMQQKDTQFKQYAIEKEKLAKQISALEQENLQINEDFQRQIKQLKSQPVDDKVAKLSQTIMELEEALKASQDKINDEQKVSKQQKEQLEMERKAEAEKSNETIKALQEKVQLNEKLLQESRKIEEQLKSEHETVVKSLEEKLAQKSNSLHPANDIRAIYVQLDKLKEHVTVIENLQQQLDAVRIRAEKAENKLQQFKEWASGLKERLIEGQKELENQFEEVEEKCRTMQANVTGLRSNLEVFRSLTETEIDEFQGS